MLRFLASKLGYCPSDPPYPASKMVELPDYTPEQRAALLASLAAHPAFQAMVATFNNQKAILESQRESVIKAMSSETDPNNFKASLLELNAGIKWLGWMHHHMTVAVSEHALNMAKES